MKKDALPRIVLRLVVGTGIFIGALSLFALFTGSVGGFFILLVMGAAFGGLGWAGQRILFSDPEDEKGPNIALIAGVIFGGAGAFALVGSIILLFQGELGGAAGLAVFGLGFGGAGYAGYRVFAVPEGKKRVLVAERTTAVRGAPGRSGVQTAREYVYVDEDVPAEDVQRQQQQWAAQPWTQRADWAAGKIVQDGPGSMRLLVGFTIVWNVIAWGIAGFGIGSEWGGDDVPWFLLLFPLVGLALAVMTVRTSIRRRKFGVSTFDLDTVPAFLGGHLRGTVETGVPARDEPAEGLCVRLDCIRRSSYRDSDGDRRVSEEELWHDEQHVHPHLSRTSRTLNVDVDVAIPADLPSSQLLPEDDRHLWRLQITASVPGVDYAAQFEVPVYSPAEPEDVA